MLVWYVLKIKCLQNQKLLPEKSCNDKNVKNNTNTNEKLNFKQIFNT